MKLTIKLPLAFVAALLLVSAAALYGIYRLNQSLNTYETQVQANNDHERAVASMALAFKIQVQEWKNTLLRGKNAKDLDKHWGAFAKQEQEVAAMAGKLLTRLPGGESKALVERFAQAHATMGINYRQGFEAYKAAGYESAAGDAAVQGMDRAPTRMLEDTGARIEADSAAVSAQAAADGRRATVLSLCLMLLMCVIAIWGSVFFSRTITRSLGHAVEVSRAVAGGDLSVEFATQGKDEIAQLLIALKQMQTSLATVVGQVRAGSESVATASAQINQGNNDLSARTEHQASSLQQTAASIEQLTTTVRQNAENSHQASQLAVNASLVAERGGDVVGKVVETMKGINHSSKKMADIISVIDSIAFQTNILALNAAVEAARAGEQGRGFAVVAAEVRNLASRSADAAKEINALIGASIDRVAQGTALVDEAGLTMAEVVGAIKKVSGLVAEISTASKEQSQGIAQVAEAITEMDEVTQKNAALCEEMAAASSSLQTQAHSLVDTVAVFRLAAA
jgi:methyl-accepting chemotaxis protein